MRKLFNNDKGLKALVIALIITTVSLFGVSYSVFAKTSSGSASDGAKTTSSTPTDAENVYVMTKADGTSYQRIVSADGTLHYKGYDSYTLPISMKITYKLDGKTVTAKQIAGKSGHVVMHISYTNNIKSGGVNVPFVVITGMALSDDDFSSVSVDNGKTMDDGSRNIVMGYSVPGMTSSLGISGSDLDIPESVTVSADTDNFKVDTMYTVVSNEPFKDLDMSNVNSIGDLKSQLSKLTSGINELVSGVTKINNGATKLSAGVKSLDTQLNTSLTAKAKASAQAQAKASVEAQFGSASDSSSYYNQIKNQASSTFYNTVASAKNISDAETAAQAQTAANLNADGIAATAKSNAEADAQKKLASDTDFAALPSVLKEGFKRVYLQKYKESTAGSAAMAEKVTSIATTLVKGGMDPTTAQQTAEAAVAYSVETGSDATSFAETNTNTTSSMLTSKIVGGAGEAASGTAKSVATQVSSNVASQVAGSVVKNVASSAKDTVGTSLADSVEKAAITSAQSATTTSITSTKSTIAKNIESQGLVSGASKLAAGTGTLKSSVDSMADQILGKLSKLSKSDLLNIVKNAKSVVDAGKSYNSFGGNGNYNSVTFIYKTDEVSPK